MHLQAPVWLGYSTCIDDFVYFKCLLLLTSAAYIKMHFRLLLIMKANTMNPDKTAPKGAV